MTGRPEALGIASASRPVGLLLDFGGVIVESEKNAQWAEQLAAAVHTRLGEAGVATQELTLERIRADLVAGSLASSRWKNAMSRPYAPRELGYEELWGDFIAADWLASAHSYVVANAKELCAEFTRAKSRKRTRPGMPELLEFVAQHGIAVGIVSNTLMGEVHRDHLRAENLTRYFAAQVYSDEVGLRKPNPELIRMGASAIGLPVEECWYVGDNVDRDVVCGVRAGVGGNIMMEASGTYDMPYELSALPHAVVADPFELRDLIGAALERDAAAAPSGASEPSDGERVL